MVYEWLLLDVKRCRHVNQK